ncbi:MAG: hypothetical protein PVI30_14975 [Myxococcales bacterium]|jgi:hypothetical protein
MDTFAALLDAKVISAAQDAIGAAKALVPRGVVRVSTRPGHGAAASVRAARAARQDYFE